MGEEWRRKTYYKPRVMISTDRVIDPQSDDALLCITGAQLEMLRNITQYLRRRSTFSEDETAVGYLSPDTADWDTIQAIVADLEEKLMGCEAFTQLFTDMLAQLECVCNTIQSISSTNPSVAPVVEDYLDDGTLIPGDIYGPDAEASADRCAVAQLVYHQAWDILTVYLQPFQETSADVMLGIILAALVATVGVAAVAVPAGIVVAVIVGLADMMVEGSLSTIRSAIVANKDELICAVYQGLQTDYASAQADARIILDGIGSFTYADKVIIGQLFAPWAIYLAATAHANATEWATSRLEAGACDDCDEVSGDDWWALRIPIEQGLIEFDHSGGGSSWVHDCYTYVIPAGQTLCGVVWVARAKVGDCELKRMTGHNGCGTGDELWGNHSSPGESEGRYFAVNGAGIDEAECKAMLAPYATDQADVYQYSNEETVNVAFDVGFACTGTWEVVIEWLVFAGSPP